MIATLCHMRAFHAWQRPSVRGPGLMAWSCALALLWPTGCARKDFPAHQQEIDQQTEVIASHEDLHAPLWAGQRLLAEVLPRADVQSQCFRLTAAGAEIIDKPLHEGLLRRQDVAVFLRIGSVDKGWKIYVFDPSTVQLHRLDPVRAAAGTGIELYRAVGVAHKPSWTQNQLDVFRFTFALDPDQGLQFRNEIRLTERPGNNLLPVHLPSLGQVAFLSETPATESRPRQRQLAMVPCAGGEVVMLSEPGSDCRALRRSEAGTLLVANDRTGHYRFWRVDVAAGTWVPADDDPRPGAGNPDALLACLVEDGIIVPTVLQLPERYDLDTLLALVGAHNVSVNRHRALLAAALVEARQLRLANRPSLSFGLGYTPAAGIFTDSPDLITGDVLAVGLTRGLFGIVQDLLAIPRNLALSEAGSVRARIARDALADELIRRQAETIICWFQARYYQELLRVDEALLPLAQTRLRDVDIRHQAGLALQTERDQAAQAQTQAEQDLQQHREHLTYQLSTLRRLCALPDAFPLELDRRHYQLGAIGTLELPALNRLAVVNNPRLQAARELLAEAFFQRKAGSRYAPSLRASADYGVTSEQGDPLEDYITTRLQGEMPMAYLADRELHQRHWDAMLQALHLGEQERAEAIGADVATALVDFQDTQRRWRSEHRQLAWSLEQVRLARLYQQYPLVETDYQANNSGLVGERENYYHQLARTLDSEASLGTTYTKLWRTVGSMDALQHRLARFDSIRVDKESPSLWLWQSRSIIVDNQAIDDFLDLATSYHIDRVYCYLDGKADTLTDPYLSERLALFLSRCHQADIQVWGLLGEPEWLDGHDVHYYQRCLDALITFNRRFAPLEPHLRGVKLDIEPHLDPSYHRDEAVRLERNRRYLQLVHQARDTLPPELPLWVDAPLVFFRNDNRDVIDDLARTVQGLTLMCYNDDPAWVRAVAADMLDRWPGPMEIGLELGTAGAPEESLAMVEPDRVMLLMNQLIRQHRERPDFAGLSLHDGAALANFHARRQAD